MGEIRFVGTGETFRYPYLVCKKQLSLLISRAGYRYPVFIENRLLTFDRYTESNVCVSNKISIHSLRRVKEVCVE